jgi:hypothetical protein
LKGDEGVVMRNSERVRLKYLQLGGGTVDALQPLSVAAVNKEIGF